MSANYKVIIYSIGGTKIGELTSQSEQNILTEVEFELNETGCGAFRFALKEIPGFNIIRNDIVEIYLMDATSPWYTGFIQNLPEIGRTDNIFEYSGFGFIAQLDNIVADKTYSSQEVSMIIKDLLDIYIVPNSNIIKNDAKIEASTYTVQEANYSKTPIKDAIFDLVKQADGWVAGVDENREFFFKQIDTSIQLAAVKAVEYHVGEFLPSEDISSLKNKLYVNGGAIADGSNYVLTVEDTTSQGKYGVREGVITIPTAVDAADVQAWAERILDELKDPLITAEISNIDIVQLGEKITAEGKARILIRPE